MKRIFYFDALRALAILMVILTHVNGSTMHITYVDYGLIPSLNWFIADFLCNSARIGVDLFLILSGALSLGREWDIKSFLSKRIPRIVAPFLFWAIITSIIFVLLPQSMIHHDTNILQTIYETLFAQSVFAYPYWFFWMILGTYLIMPVFNKWLQHSSLSEAEYFLIIWLVTCLFDYTINIECPVKLSYFTSPIGLVVLGYYLRHNTRRLLNNPYFGVFLIIASSLLMIGISYMFSSTTTMYKFDRYSITIAFEVIGIVILFKNFEKFNLKLDKLNFIKKYVFSLAKYSYGIYLIHSIILLVLVLTAPFEILHYKLSIIYLFLGTAVISWIVMAVLNRIPYVNQLIGAK